MTFAQPFAEWRGMFAGNTMLLPESMTANPEVFNKGQLNGPGPSAGPFIISALDRTAQRITLTRNPKWWGTPPLLDSVTYLVLDDAARIPALQNNTIDATGVPSLDELTIARNTPGISIRRAPSASWYHMTFNGAPGSILADKALRLAISKGIDRQAIANITQRGLADDPVPLNNHLYVAGQEGYQDNSGVVAFDPEKAKQELDALGWRLNGQFREKDGRQLVIRDVLAEAQTTRQVAQIAQNNLAQIGVKLDLDVKSGGGFFTNYINVGDFDIAQFSWVGDAFSLCCINQIYTTGADSNFGKISSPEIDKKAEETMGELDPAKARELANEVDKLIWAEGFGLPLFQSAGNVAVRSSLANYGPAGIGDLDVTKIGFMKP
jgi:peptide/nickel transport system substrate-binding protein